MASFQAAGDGLVVTGDEQIADREGDTMEEVGDDCGDEDGTPVTRLVIPSDVVPVSATDDTIYIVGTQMEKVTKIAGLNIAKDCLENLTLRCCLISSMEGVESLINLKKLELYDNQVQKLSSLEHLQNLQILDMSFNAVRDMSPVSCCPNLTELYLAQNKLRKIQGIALMKNLRVLDLGANRIREMEEIEGLTSLESLWLGKNKIEVIQGVAGLSLLRQLDVQSNRLRGLAGLADLPSLQELYLAHNIIDSICDLPVDSPLQTLDLSSNPITSLVGIENAKTLEELWMSSARIASFDAVSPLTRIPNLTCLYLEHNPLSSDFEYRLRLTQMLPALEQLDATEVSRR